MTHTIDSGDTIDIVIVNGQVCQHQCCPCVGCPLRMQSPEPLYPTRFYPTTPWDPYYTAPPPNEWFVPTYYFGPHTGTAAGVRW